MKTFVKSPLVPADERPRIAPDESAGWNYEGTEIPVVGARDITLAEVADPRLVGRAGKEPEAVLLSLAEIEADPRLLWAVEKGKRLDGDREPEYKVPFPIWQEHADEPVGAWVPEWDGFGLDRALALVERRYRFAKLALDEVGELRQSMIVLAARLGRSRRVVGETTGLSAARVQQLIEAWPDELLADLEEFVDSAARVACSLGRDTRPRDELRRPRGVGGDEFEELVSSMISVGLAEAVGDDGLKLTVDGLALVEARGKKQKPDKSDPDRERAGHATG